MSSEDDHDHYLCPGCQRTVPSANPKVGYAKALTNLAKAMEEAQALLMSAITSACKALPSATEVQELREAARRLGRQN